MEPRGNTVRERLFVGLSALGVGATFGLWSRPAVPSPPAPPPRAAEVPSPAAIRCASLPPPPAPVGDPQRLGAHALPFEQRKAHHLTQFGAPLDPPGGPFDPAAVAAQLTQLGSSDLRFLACEDYPCQGGALFQDLASAEHFRDALLDHYPDSALEISPLSAQGGSLVSFVVADGVSDEAQQRRLAFLSSTTLRGLYEEIALEPPVWTAP